MNRRRVVCLALAAVLAAAVPLRSAGPARRHADLPASLTDQEFWQLSAALSEPPGSFHSENLVSNETMLQWVIPELTQTVPPGGVYLGVAPDQNFTYIVALKPRIAFIVDIRRGNVLEHLLYKALFELSTDRADFLSRLFSRKRPAGLGAASSAAELVAAYAPLGRDEGLFSANQKAVLDLLEKRHAFALSPADEEGLRFVYTAFFLEGPGLTYQYPGGNAFGGGFGRGVVMRGLNPFATWGDLQQQSDARGVDHGYLASEANFAWLKAFEGKNLIVPLTGDFAGPSALRAVGGYLRDHGASVGAFYTSNVEQYLFEQGADWVRFYQNVATLPLDATSTFIRSVPNSYVAPDQPGARAASMLCAIAAVVKAFGERKIESYADVIALSHQPNRSR